MTHSGAPFGIDVDLIDPIRAVGIAFVLLSFLG